MSIWTNVAAAPERPEQVEDLVIVGSGPAGCTAAIYAARAKLQPLVIEGATPGGLLQETETVENFPGYPNGVLGPELVADLREQATRFGTSFLGAEATCIELATEPGGEHLIETTERTVRARAVILAMGAAPRRLGVPGEAELGAGRGIAYCAVCEAPLYADRRTVVVGGGDSAMEEALGLARHAKSVVLIHRRNEFRASPIMLDRVVKSDKIEVLTEYEVEFFGAGSDGKLSSAALRHTRDGATRSLSVDGAFIAIGHIPRSELVRDQLDVDEAGFVVCDGHTRATSAPGVFACGDLVDARYRQAVTAAGSGCQAALDAQAYLES
jgi:thioredoxin reductase (NADPH)